MAASSHGATFDLTEVRLIEFSSFVAQHVPCFTSALAAMQNTEDCVGPGSGLPGFNMPMTGTAIP
jgi:hypothetical protein